MTKKISFDFQNNPEKTIAASTQKIYKQKLNALTKNILDKSGNPFILNHTDILNNSQLVADYVKSIQTKQAKNLTLASIFYAIGRQDFDKDPRGLPIYQAFQENYRKKTEE